MRFTGRDAADVGKFAALEWIINRVIYVFGFTVGAGAFLLYAGLRSSNVVLESLLIVGGLVLVAIGIPGFLIVRKISRRQNRVVDRAIDRHAN